MDVSERQSREKCPSLLDRCQTFFLRVFVNFVIMCLIGLSMLAIWMVAQITEKDTFIKQVRDSPITH